MIHGYGSSGNGVALYVGLLKSFALRKKEAVIKDFIAGEDFSIFNDTVLALLEAVPELRGDPDLGATNDGVTCAKRHHALGSTEAGGLPRTALHTPRPAPARTPAPPRRLNGRPPFGRNIRVASQIGLGGVIQTNCSSMLSASL